MSYSILRVERVKNTNDTTGIQKHVQRETKNYTNLDIDKSKINMNYDLINSTTIDFNKKIKERLEEGYKGKRKIRTDAIRHVDGLITSDNEFFEDMSESEIRQFFEDSLEFVKTEYGSENLLYATVHLDEKTPHMHFGFVPLTKDGRLSAKDVLGNKKALSLLQDRFNDFVNENGYKMERGESSIDTERKHIEMNKFKKQTEYHRKELEDVTEELDIQLGKWGKLHVLDTKEEREAFNTIVATKRTEPVPNVEIKEKLFGRVEIDPEEVKKLQDWGKGAVDLLKKQQKSMEKKDKEIKKLNELVQLQEKEVDKRVKDKYKQKIDKFESENAHIRNNIYGLIEENEQLKEENKTLMHWKERAIDFMERTKVYSQFKEFFKRFTKKRNGFER